MARRIIEVELDKVRRIKFDYNAVADLEAKYNTGIGVMLSEERAGFNTIRGIMWAGLKWEDRQLTIEKVGNLLQAYIEKDGDLQELTNLAVEALKGAGIIKVQEVQEGNVETEAAE